MAEDSLRWEPLGCGVRVSVSRTHSFGTDALLLADFAAPRQGEIACDLGSGCGIIPLLWCRGDMPAQITAVDIQPDACQLLRQSVSGNGLEHRITIVQADLRKHSEKLKAGAYALVTMNPPYKALHTGAVSAENSARLARHEAVCTLEDAAAGAARLLRSGGRFCLCQKPERLCDVLTTLRAAGLEPKRLRFVSHRAGKAPWLLLVEARRGGRPGLRMEPELLLQNSDGTDSGELRRIYSKYAQETGKKQWRAT